MDVNSYISIEKHEGSQVPWLRRERRNGWCIIAWYRPTQMIIIFIVPKIYMFLFFHLRGWKRILFTNLFLEQFHSYICPCEYIGLEQFLFCINIFQIFVKIILFFLNKEKYIWYRKNYFFSFRFFNWTINSKSNICKNKIRS